MAYLQLISGAICFFFSQKSPCMFMFLLKHPSITIMKEDCCSYIGCNFISHVFYSNKAPKRFLFDSFEMDSKPFQKKDESKVREAHTFPNKELFSLKGLLAGPQLLASQCKWGSIL